MWTERGMEGGIKRERGGERNQKKAFMKDLVGESKKKKVIFIIRVLVKSTDVCIACECWIFAAARIFGFVGKNLCTNNN